MATRLELQSKLSNIEGVSKVYFQPPESVKLVYPCIIYHYAGDYVYHADDLNYKRKDQYTITVIDKNPDSEIHKVLRDWDYCSFDRGYTADNLNHWVYSLYY